MQRALCSGALCKRPPFPLIADRTNGSRLKCVSVSMWSQVDSAGTCTAMTWADHATAAGWNAPCRRRLNAEVAEPIIDDEVARQARAWSSQVAAHNAKRQLTGEGEEHELVHQAKMWKREAAKSIHQALNKAEL
jgi:hypothetical protein